jgi:suppressor of fused
MSGPTSSELNDDAAPGGDAINSHLARFYQGEPVLHVAAAVPRVLGGDSVLDWISGYRAEAPAHIHLVTYGLSELYRKESEIADVSGFGFELTMRVALRDDDEPAAASTWAFNLLRELANYVWSNSRGFAPGHRMSFGRPVAPGTRISAVAFTTDPQLGEIQTPNGRLQFLQAVGLTSEELELAKSWGTTRLLDAMREANPLLVTDLARNSMLDDESTREHLWALARAEQAE